MTPLLDLAFLLLIIFMITAPFLAGSAEMLIPTSKTAHDAIDPSNVHTISINNTGALKLNETDVNLWELENDLQTLQQKKDIAVLIKAHRDLSVQKLIELMDVLKKIGITKVGVLTESTRKVDHRS